MTAGLEVHPTHPIGFQRGDAAPVRPAEVDLTGGLGEALAAQVDLVCTTVLQTDATRRRWIEDSLLADLSARYSKHGVNLKWDDSFVRWLLERHGASANQRDWERVMDESLGPLLMPYVPDASIRKPASLVITCEKGFILTWGDNETVINCRAYVVNGAERTPEMLEYLLRENYDMRFGAFGLDKEGAITFEQNIVGSTCDKNELKASVMAVLGTADKYDDEIVARWGGKRSSDR